MDNRLVLSLTLLLTLSIFQSLHAQSGTIRGTVVNAITHEPLPGANVTIQDTAPLIGTSTDAKGEFLLQKVPLGRHDIQITYLGYQPVIRSGIMVSSGKETVLTIKMKEAIFEGQQVEVTPDVQKNKPINEMSFVSARSFSVEETRRYAGGLDDPSRMATAFAGVTSTGGVQDNALVIRGNAPKSVQWRLEGISIPNPNHFAGLSVTGGGGLTLFSGQMLSDSDFLTGAFPAQYGNALSGVFDMNFRSGNPNQPEYAAQIGINGIEAASEGPVNHDGSATYLVNYRYSTLALIMPLLPTEGGIRYQDLSFKMDYRTPDAGRFSFWGIGGWDGQNMNATPDSSDWKYDFWDRVEYEMNLGVAAAGMEHRILLGDKTFLTSSLASTIEYTAWDQQRLNDQIRLAPDLKIQNTTGSLVLRSTINHKFASRHNNRTGFEVRHLYYNLDVKVAPVNQPPLIPYVSGDGSSQLIQFFTQSRYNLLPNLTFHGGVHTQWFTLSEQVSIEPRAGLEWRISDKSSINLGYGLHSQLEPLRIYFVQPENHLPNRDLSLAKAHHFIAGYNLDLNHNTRLKIEAFEQRLFDVPVIPDSSFSMLNFVQDWSFNEKLVNEGEGHNYGLELTLERFLSGGFYYLFTGTVYKSRYRGGTREWYNTRYDQEFAFNLLTGKEFSWKNGQRIFGLNSRVSYVGGERHSTIDHATSRRFEEVRFFNNRAYSKKFDPRLIVDLSLTFRINRKQHSSVWALQVKNLLFEKDPTFDYNLQTHRVDKVEEGTPLPIISYKIEF